MSVVDISKEIWKFNRVRTLATLDDIEKMPNSQEVLGWRAAPGRAHIAWQLMHIGITEELFASERIHGREPSWSELVPRFKGGSTPDDDIPSVDRIREILSTSREHLFEAVSNLNQDDLNMIPEAFKERGWTVGIMLCEEIAT